MEQRVALGRELLGPLSFSASVELLEDSASVPTSPAEDTPRPGRDAAPGSVDDVVGPRVEGVLQARLPDRAAAAVRDGRLVGRASLGEEQPGVGASAGCLSPPRL